MKGVMMKLKHVQPQHYMEVSDELHAPEVFTFG
jgi:hypothetical protein